VNFPFIAIDLQELRDWISFIFLIIGGTIAIRTFVLSQRQRRLENSFRLIDLCNKTLTDNDRINWHTIHVASCEQTGAKRGFFVENGKQVPFLDLFQPNVVAQDSIARFCELFNLVCYEYLKGTLDIRLFYFEYGQYMSTTYYWASNVDNNRDFIRSSYPFFFKAFKRRERRFLQLPHKTVSLLE